MSANSRVCEQLPDTERAASQEECERLSLEDAAPITNRLEELGVVFADAEHIIEWSEDRYLDDAVAFTVHDSLAANSLTRTPTRPAS